MKTVQQIMQETNAEANVRNFRYMQQHYTYEQKVRHAENVAASFEEQCRARGLNCHVSVGGLDSITLHYFLEECGISVPCVSCSTLEQKGVQAVHKQIAAEMEARYPAEYGEIVRDADGTLRTTGAQRTGYTMCGFGIHMEKRPHRFDRLRESNPKEWEFWMRHVCRDSDGNWYGWGRVLDYIGVEWENAPGQIPGQMNMFE